MHTTTEASTSMTHEEYTLPSAEALLAATLALMTGHAQSQSAAHRSLMEIKIASHLAQLALSQEVSDNFRQMLGSLQRHWGARHCGPLSAWHTPVATLQ